MKLVLTEQELCDLVKAGLKDDENGLGIRQSYLGKIVIESVMLEDVMLNDPQTFVIVVRSENESTP